MEHVTFKIVEVPGIEPVSSWLIFRHSNYAVNEDLEKTIVREKENGRKYMKIGSGRKEIAVYFSLIVDSHFQ